MAPAPFFDGSAGQAWERFSILSTRVSRLPFAMAVLIPDRGPCAGQVYMINRTPYVLGRSPGCDLLDVFSDNSRVSRQHARLVEISNDFYVEDLRADVLLD